MTWPLLSRSLVDLWVPDAAKQHQTMTFSSTSFPVCLMFFPWKAVSALHQPRLLWLRNFIFLCLHTHSKAFGACVPLWQRRVFLAISSFGSNDYNFFLNIHAYCTSIRLIPTAARLTCGCYDSISESSGLVFVFCAQLLSWDCWSEQSGTNRQLSKISSSWRWVSFSYFTWWLYPFTKP